MTQEELEKLFIKTIDGVFTPQYTYDDYDSETRSYSNLIIVKTAEEVHQEWMVNKDKQIDILEMKPKTNEELTRENEQLWETIQFLLKKTGMIGDEEYASN